MLARLPAMPEEEAPLPLGRKLDRIVKITAGVFEQLGVVAHADLGNLLPFNIRQRDAKGENVETPILLACLLPQQRWKARKRARERAAEFGLDARREGEGAQDADLVKELERLEELAFAIRECDTKNPSQQHIDGAALQQAVPNYRVLEEVYTALDQWTLMNDPRFGELDGVETWRVINEVAKTGTTRPLWLIGGLEQIGCIIFSARQAVRSPTNPFLPPLPSTSPLESSTPSSDTTPPS